MTIYWTCEPIEMTQPGDWVICPYDLLPFIVIIVIGIISYMFWRMGISR